MDTLFREVYLLVGVIMAANIFVVNEVRAMNQQNVNETEEEKNFFTKKSTSDTTRKILFWENYVNFFVTLAFSGANNYFKWWNYDAGGYRQFVWFGWRSKRFLNDIFQFEINFNVVRGIPWLIPGYLFFAVQKHFVAKTENACSLTISSLFFLTRNRPAREVEKENQFRMKVIAFPLFILQGFISAPLTLHLSIFSIAISLDAILWELVDIWAHKKRTNFNPSGGNWKMLELGQPIKFGNENELL